MKGPGRLSREWIRDMRVAWLFLLAATVVLSGVTAASVWVYGGVAQAHALTSMGLGYEVTFTGTNATGVLGDAGTVTGTLRITVVNPSPRVLDFDSVSYKAWIEDLPAEAGLTNLGRTDQALVNETGTHLFYMAFYGSLEVSPVPIPAGGQSTLPLALNLTRVSGPAAFAALQNITAYAAAVRGSADGIPWTVWVQLGLPIEGVPTPDFAAPTYQFEVGRVVISGGVDLGG